MGYGSLSTVQCADLVIANTTTASRWVENEKECSDAAFIGIACPSTLDALTFTFEVTDDATVAVPVTMVLQAGTPFIDVTLPAAGKAATFTDILAFKFWRIKSSGAVAGNRTIKLSKQVVIQ